MVARAFGRTAVMMAGKKGRTDVSDHMVKWWTKFRPDEGQVVRNLSPYETHPVMPWFKTFPKKTIERAPAWILNVGGTIGLTWFILNTIAVGEREAKLEHRY